MMNIQSTLLASSLCSLVFLASAASAQTALQNSADPVQVYAAGSLRGPMTKIASEYQERTGQKIILTFGASGLLRERIEKGEPVGVFASADTTHPQRLADGGSWHAPVVFVRNAMCALTSEKVLAEPSTLLSVMLKPDVRVGTSTPKSDPSGDYAWALFAKAEAVQPGAFKTLDGKALKLTGAANSPQPPAGKTFYGWAMDEGQADVFLTYCTNAVAAQVEVPRLKIVRMPSELKVDAAYALTVNKTASTAAVTFAQALLEQPAQVIFNRFGFGSP